MKAAIIGAGIAGLTTARELTKRGVKVKVFEKSRGIGGRLANKRLEWANIDMGAQYFTARDKRFQTQVDQWQDAGTVARWQFNPHSLTTAGLTTRPDLTHRFVGADKMNGIAHDLAHGIDIELNTRMEALQYTSEGWVLQTSEGMNTTEPYDWVVVALPAEQSKVLLVGTVIEHQIPEQIHEPCWALALATRGQVAAEIQGIFGDEIVSWVSRLSACPHRYLQHKESGQYDDLWMLHFSSDWSAAHAQDSTVNVSHVGVDWLSGVLRNHIDRPLKVVHDFKHYWRYARVKKDNVMPSPIADRSTGVAAIGAWTAGGRVEGAYLSALEFVDFLFDENK